MRYQMDSSNAGEMESSSYVALDRDPDTNPAIFVDCSNLPSLTRQEFAEECDINVLMAKFEKTGIFPGSLNPNEPRYLDVSDVPDLMQAHNVLQEATAAFMALPATVRRDFDNDPLNFVTFAENPDNLEKMREWKLAPPEPAPEPPQRVEIVNPPEPAPAPKT
jgi:phage internal scaffolding protein